MCCYVAALDCVQLGTLEALDFLHLYRYKNNNKSGYFGKKMFRQFVFINFVQLEFIKTFELKSCILIEHGRLTWM